MVRDEKYVQKVTLNSLCSFLFTLVRVEAIIISSYIIFSKSQTNTTICIILGTILSFFFFYIFIKIKDNKYEEDIINLNIKLFGKLFGNILNVIINISYFILANLLLYNVCKYIDIQYLPNSTSLYIKILLLMPVVYTATKNIATISRVSQVIFLFNLFLFIIGILGISDEFKILNIFPLLDNKIDLKLNIYSILLYAISIAAPIFLLTIIPNRLIEKDNKYLKHIFKMYLLSTFMVAAIIIATILILGIDIINIYKFPIFMALRHFSAFTIIERVERILSIQFIVDVILFLIITIYFLTTSLNKIFKLKKIKNSLTYIISILTLIVSCLFFKNGSFIDLIVNKYFIYFLGFGIILPFFITFLGIIFHKQNKSESINK